ncbi:SmpA/OmlA family protein [Hasllibacter halocynthiae]|uniref:SmpA/OmlA family protein n=1 Tax=Hasllibacter halocynthiae TaxID=595589 RepID=A0A2T0X3A1_9RHOB|nr:outer membrane protein assembly factor BamE [Hasllibacter halocynthiae]PRY93411.1 SmpA/OmlA family protein [Hasllibacter halocynthiae]
MNATRLPAALALSLAIAFGGASLPGPAAAELDVVDPDRGFPRVSRPYESMDAAFSRVGIPRSVAQIRQVRVGGTKADLVRALGRPVSAYADGSWNYDLSLDYPQANRLVCQYRVYFDAAGRVEETVWRRPQCAAVVRGGRRRAP